MQNRRVIAYIDGFNLYFGLKTQRWRRYYWIDLQLLARNLLKPDQELVFTKYFTSRVSLPPDEQVVAAFPPQRFSVELAKHVHAYLTIGRANLAKSLFPDKIQKADGYVLQRPPEWK